MFLGIEFPKIDKHTELLYEVVEFFASQTVISSSETSKPGMKCKTRGRVSEGGQPDVKTDKCLQIFVNFW